MIMCALKIGWSKRELSTTEPISIPGQMYIRVSEGIHDPLYATALCVDGGENQDAVIFCTCDVVVLRGDVINLVRNKIGATRPEIPIDAIVMGATHTHCGGNLSDTPEATPDGKKIYPGSKYREFFVNQCVDAICEAWDSRTEGGISYGYSYAVAGHSRRTVYFDDVSLRNKDSFRSFSSPNGHGVMYGNTNHPMFSHYEAGADHFLNVMLTFDKEQNLTGIIANVPVPSQAGGGLRMLSADYWNEVREYVAREFGNHVYLLPQCGPGGDQAPRTLHYRQAQHRRIFLKYGLDYDSSTMSEFSDTYLNRVMGERYDIADQILTGIRDVYSWAKKDIQTELPVRHIRKTVQLSRRMVTAAEKAKAEECLKKMESMVPSPEQLSPEDYRVEITRYNSTKNRLLRNINRYETQAQETKLETVIHAVQIGDIAFATNRFELYIDYMHRIQARSPFIQTFCIQLAGDGNGSYLATERGIANKGYSASIACNQVGFEGGQELVEFTLETLNELKSKEEI